jgi:hypothetical protein
MFARVLRLAAAGILVAGLSAALLPKIVEAGEQGVSVTVKGESWDSDSGGFAFFGGLSKAENEVTSARRGSRISVDGQPDRFAIAGPGPGFELTFTTDEPTFRLIVDGDRFPRVITQPYEVPEGGGEINIGKIKSPRAEGVEHTWPLPMAAAELGYESALAMMADNKAVIRILNFSSGVEGAPPFADKSVISVSGSDAEIVPFGMDPADTFLLMTGPSDGFFLIIIPFAEGDGLEKTVTLQITDTVSEPTWDPPRPWIYDPMTVIVRNGFATEVRARPSID